MQNLVRFSVCASCMMVTMLHNFFFFSLFLLSSEIKKETLLFLAQR